MPRPLSVTVQTALFQDDLNLGTVARQGFVDRVVHDFIDQMMQPGFIGRADVHAWALADRLQPI